MVTKSHLIFGLFIFLIQNTTAIALPSLASFLAIALAFSPLGTSLDVLIDPNAQGGFTITPQGLGPAEEGFPQYTQSSFHSIYCINTGYQTDLLTPFDQSNFVYPVGEEIPIANMTKSMRIQTIGFIQASLNSMASVASSMTVTGKNGIIPSIKLGENYYAGDFGQMVGDKGITLDVYWWNKEKEQLCGISAKETLSTSITAQQYCSSPTCMTARPTIAISTSAPISSKPTVRIPSRRPTTAKPTKTPKRPQMSPRVIYMHTTDLISGPLELLSSEISFDGGKVADSYLKEGKTYQICSPKTTKPCSAWLANGRGFLHLKCEEQSDYKKLKEGSPSFKVDESCFTFGYVISTWMEDTEKMEFIIVFAM